MLPAWNCALQDTFPLMNLICIQSVSTEKNLAKESDFFARFFEETKEEFIRFRDFFEAIGRIISE